VGSARAACCLLRGHGEPSVALPLLSVYLCYWHGTPAIFHQFTPEMNSMFACQVEWSS
jgi:hypothetical protein